MNKSRAVALLAALGLVLGGGAVTSSAVAEVAPAHSAQPASPLPMPLIRSQLNDRCLEIYAGHQEDGASVVMWDCHGGPSEQWYWDGEQIRTRLNGKCLEIYAFHQGNGAPVSTWRCDGGNNQRWYREGDQIRSRMNGKCLDIIDNRPGNGELVWMWDCNGGKNQQWNF
ncbi:RICIN domain-containing protein [Streptoalloteichus hindustanus]|uniref:Ricin-type beta-trefoil lectin domain-containing protein n=1 Tax=Streptoalloteichus hindustanus TaxID=2017 RepID=A0A1M5D898_STRHI|nr:RICIN domain-containing protein [Streptoalloteichus hindustanus]SHF63161.1 Ricin-type beta-trefoil lectin domain-containing protein [Streptoalloteichus hindustanus]